jgi:hypothetical protein
MLDQAFMLASRLPEAEQDRIAARLLDLLRDGAAKPNPDAAPRDADAWIAELRAWAASHRPIAGTVDDSRESIYAGRGE